METTVDPHAMKPMSSLHYRPQVKGGSDLNLDGSVQGPIIALEDGSKFYFLRAAPSTLMLVGTGTGGEKKSKDEESRICLPTQIPGFSKPAFRTRCAEAYILSPTRQALGLTGQRYSDS